MQTAIKYILLVSILFPKQNKWLPHNAQGITDDLDKFMVFFKTVFYVSNSSICFCNNSAIVLKHVSIIVLAK
jgi:hypothetical protein